MKEKFSLTKKMAELEAIEAYCAAPDSDLEESLAKHRQAVTLTTEILAYLQEAESELHKLDLSTGATREASKEE